MKKRTSLSEWFLLLFTLCSMFTFAELGCRDLLPEVNDTSVFRTGNSRSKYHHEPVFREPLANPDPRAFRIMFLGDSFVYSTASPPESTLPRMLEAYLNNQYAAGHSNEKAQVFNLGYPSYSPSIYGVLLRDYEPKLKPGLVIIAVDDSDPQDDYIYRKTLIKDDNDLPISVYPAMPGVPEWLKPLAVRIKLIRLSCYALYTIKPPKPSTDDLIFGIWRNRYGHYRPNEVKKWESAFSRTINLIGAMINYCRQRDIKVMVVNYPYPPLLIPDHCPEWCDDSGLKPGEIYKSEFHKVVKNFVLSQRVIYYDFTNYLRNCSNVKELYEEKGGHFNADGNKLFARQLARIIVPIIGKK
jgi:hypothetical protein